MATVADRGTGPDRESPGRESGVPDTGPQAVLRLRREQGLTTREIADRLPISQATVTRRIREALEARRSQHRALAMTVMLILLTLCAVISTAAFATLAWG